MSDFNKTIPIKSMQAGTGSVGTTAAPLTGVRVGTKARKGVTIKNTHATQKLYVFDTRVSATLGYELGVNESISLDIETPSDINVVGNGATTTYTWLAY